MLGVSKKKTCQRGRENTILNNTVKYTINPAKQFLYYWDRLSYCNNEIEEIVGKNPCYCPDCGCSQCFYEKEGSYHIKEGDWRCQKHYEEYVGFKKIFAIEAEVKKIRDLDHQLATEIKSISEDFFNLIKEATSLINSAKEKLLYQQIGGPVFQGAAGGSIIESYSPFSATENAEWKKIYDPSRPMADICQTEKTFLIGLATEYKNKSEIEKARLAAESLRKSEEEKRRKEEEEPKPEKPKDNPKPEKDKPDNPNENPPRFVKAAIIKKSYRNKK